MDASKFMSLFDTNRDGFVEKNEFLEVLAFKHPKKAPIKVSNIPIVNYTSNLTKETEQNNPNLQKIALHKMQSLLYTKEFSIYFEKKFGKYEAVGNFSISRQDFKDFLQSLPKSSSNKENIVLSNEEIQIICQKADYDRKNVIKFQEFFEFLKSLNFEPKEKSDFDKLRDFLIEEAHKDPFEEEENKMKLLSMPKEKKKEEKLQKLEQMVEKSIKSSGVNEVNEESINEEMPPDEQSIKKKLAEDFSKEQKKKYQEFCEQRIPGMLQSIKHTYEDFKKLKATKNDLFFNEGKYFISIFVNPLVCLKRSLIFFNN